MFEREFLPASEHGWRNRWYRWIFHHEAKDERNFDLVLIAAILASIAIVMLDSVSAVKARWHDVLYVIEWAFTILFTVEYGLRLWSVKRPLRYATSFFGVIDLLAILPTYLSLLFLGGNYLIVIRVLRLLRVFRILKLVQYSSEAGVLITSLLRSRYKILVFLCALLTVVTIFGSLMYVIEGPAHGFTSIPTSMYWAVVTMATVGFGDISPTTGFGRLVTSVLILIGYSVIAVPTGIFTAELANTLRPPRHQRDCTGCGLSDHEADAQHCRKCGAPLSGK
ncbi:MAG: ion transporter [Pseudoxanthomonas sp.]